MINKNVFIKNIGNFANFLFLHRCYQGNLNPCVNSNIPGVHCNTNYAPCYRNKQVCIK